KRLGDSAAPWAIAAPKSAVAKWPGLHQPALHHRGLDEGRKQRVRLKGPRLQLGVELHADEPGMVFVFDDLRQHAVGRQAREAQAMLFEAVLVGGVDLITVAVALGDLGRAAIDSRQPAAA